MRNHGKYSVLTRKDDGGEYDSIKWLFDTCLRPTNDDGIYNFALLYGNEDSPERVELWRSDSPMYNELPDRVWTFNWGFNGDQS